MPHQLHVEQDLVQAVPGQLSDKPDQVKPHQVRVVTISWKKTDTNRLYNRANVYKACLQHSLQTGSCFIALAEASTLMARPQSCTASNALISKWGSIQGCHN